MVHIFLFFPPKTALLAGQIGDFAVIMMKLKNLGQFLRINFLVSQITINPLLPFNITSPKTT